MRRSMSLVLVLALAGCGGIQRAQRGSEASEDRSSLAAARAALNEGQAGTSLAIARGILASQPQNVSARAEAGDAQAAMGDRLSAETSYKAALRIAPHDVRARLGMGKLLLRDNLKGAELAFRAILVDAPHDPVVLNDLGYVLDLQERHADAQNIYLEALASDPSRLSTRVNLALSLALSGQADKAEQMLRDLAQNAGATSKVRLDFALAQVIAGHDQDAEITMSADLSPEEAKNALAGMEQLRPASSTPSK
jgi:Flp pilus assembly protein TadD